MKKKDTGINSFQKYLTVWVILCIVIGILIGKILLAIPEVLGKMEIAGISVVCNKAAGLGGVLSHEDIIKTGDTASDKLKKLILASINRIDGDSDR